MAKRPIIKTLNFDKQPVARRYDHIPASGLGVIFLCSEGVHNIFEVGKFERKISLDFTADKPDYHANEWLRVNRVPGEDCWETEKARSGELDVDGSDWLMEYSLYHCLEAWISDTFPKAKTVYVSCYVGHK